MLEVGKIYKFRSGARLVLSEPETDIDGIEKVRTCRVPIGNIYVLAANPTTIVDFEELDNVEWKYAPYVYLNGLEFVPGSSSDWSHAKSATHEMELIGDPVQPDHFNSPISLIRWNKLKK